MDWLVPWTAAHPGIVHFPIALLLTAPVFVVVAMIAPRARTAFGVSALVLMLIGAAGAVLAVASGEASEHAITVPAAAHDVLEHHEDLGKLTRNLFVLLTVAWGAILFVPFILGQRIARWPFRTLSAVFLVLYVAAAGVLINTAHQGGRVVHEYGVLAPRGGPPPAAP